MRDNDKSNTALILIANKMGETPLPERWSMATIIDGFNDLWYAYKEQTIEDKNQDQQSKDINQDHISRLLFDTLSAIAVLYGIKDSLDEYLSEKFQELKSIK